MGVMAYFSLEFLPSVEFLTGWGLSQPCQIFNV